MPRHATVVALPAMVTALGSFTPAVAGMTAMVANGLAGFPAPGRVGQRVLAVRA